MFMHEVLYLSVFFTLWFGFGIAVSVRIISRMYKMFGSLSNAMKLVDDGNQIPESENFEDTLKFLYMIIISLFWPAFVLEMIEKQN